MRVALVTEPGDGGVGRHVIDLAVGLRALGVEISVYCGLDRIGAELPGRLTQTGVPFVALPDLKRSLGQHDARAFANLRRRLGEDGPFDIVHSHSSKAGALVRAIPGLGKRVHTPHGYAFTGRAGSPAGRLVYRGVESLLSATTDHTIAVSADEARLARQLPFTGGRVRIIHNGIPRLIFADRDLVRADWSIAADDFVVGFVGRLSKQKRPLRFIEAIAVAHRIEPRIKGVVVGSGELRQAVDLRIHETGMGTIVRTVQSDAAWSLMNAFDLFALPSAYEALPYVILEAQQAGLPVIADNVGGAAELVEASGSGIVLADGAGIDVFAAAIVAAAGDRDAYSRQRENALRHAEYFTVDRMVHDIAELYSDVISRKAGQ